MLEVVLPTNISSMVQMVVFLNNNTTQWFSKLLILGLWLVMFLVMKPMTPAGALFVSTIITLLVGLMLLVGGMVGWDVILMLLVGLILATGYMVAKSKDPMG